MVYVEGDAPFAIARLNFDYARPNSNFVSIGCCTVLDPDVWYHVTVVADATAGTITIYDGTIAEAESPLPRSLPPGDPTLYMGKWRAVDIDRSLGGWFSGTIDDVTIFSRALTPSEVADLDAAPVPPF